MTRPRRVLTVVVGECNDCPKAGRPFMSIGGRWRRRCEAVIDLRVVNAHERPPEWCPLPKEEP